MVKRRVTEEDCFDELFEPASWRDRLAGYQVMVTMLLWIVLARFPIEMAWSNTARMAKHLIS